MSLPNQRRSRIVLIGTSDYEDPKLPGLPAVANNLADLANLLTGPGGVLPPEACSVLLNPPDVPSLGRELRRLAAEASDLLLIYYAGHGLIGTESHELYLALPGSQHDDPFYSALPFEGIRRAMRESPASTRVLILDCCFSGRAIEDVMAGTDYAVLGQLEVTGTFLLTATPSNVLAMAPVGARNTSFTGAFLATLENGIPGGPEFLMLDDIYRATVRTSQLAGIPLPQRRGTATADRLILARNPRWTTCVPSEPHPVTQSTWEGESLPSVSKKRPVGGPRRNADVEHVTFRQYRILYAIAAVVFALISILFAFIISTESSVFGRGLWFGLTLLALLFTYYTTSFARFPISIDIGARGLELFHRRGWIWLPWSAVQRVELVRHQGKSLIVAWFNGSNDFPEFDTLGGGPTFMPKLGGAALCSVGILHAPRQEIARALRYFDEYRR